MSTIAATTRSVYPPAWAALQRQLIATMNESVYPMLEKYTDDDGTLIWRDEFITRDGADDGYESFHTWPLLYILGGGDHLLPLSIKEWDAVTWQFTGYGQIHKEFEIGYDWFHQGESYIYFYYLSLADPTGQKQVARAQRFAGFYLNEDPEAPNYDPDLKLIRAPHNGSGGPRWGFSDEDPPSYGWGASMRSYGLPFHDVPGITHYDDLKDPALARRMGQAMHERLGRGDVPANLAVTSLVTNAYLHTGDEKYKRWVLDYVEAWIERARENGGLLPDNVGLSGKIGEYNNGKWWGGLYGWTWPHGFYNIGMAAIIAASNALLLTGDHSYLDLPRTQIDRIIEQGIVENGTLKVPYRYRDDGWFEYREMDLLYPVAVWNMSMADGRLAAYRAPPCIQRERLAGSALLPQQARRRARGAVAAVPRRRQSDLSGGHPQREPGAGLPPHAPDPRGRGRPLAGQRSPLAAAQPRTHGGPRADHPRRAAGRL